MPEPRAHILRVTPSYLPHVTGPNNQAAEISKRLKGLGYPSSIVTTTIGAGAYPSREMVEGCSVAREPVIGGFMQYRLAPSAWSTLLATPADIIHAHSYRSFMTDAAALAARRRNLPFVLHLHGSLSMYRSVVGPGRRWLYQGYDLLTRFLPTLRRTSFVVSTESEAAEARAYGLPADRIRVIPMGIDCGEYAFSGVERDPMRIVLVGRLAAGRNVEQLVRALARIRDLDWSCLVVGDEARRTFATPPGYLRDLSDLVKECRLEERITFTGPLYGEELRRMYASAGIFVYTSRYENFGQTILEAAASGCALVSTPVGVATDIIGAGEAGCLVPIGDHFRLARCLRDLLNDAGAQRAFGERARAIAGIRYSWSRVTRAYADLYSGLTSESLVPVMSVARRSQPGGARQA